MLTSLWTSSPQAFLYPNRLKPPDGKDVKMENFKNGSNITFNGDVNINGNVTVEETKTEGIGSFNITEDTTLGELIKLLNPGKKPYETPTPKKLRENAGDPIAHYSLPKVNYFGAVTETEADPEEGCTVYANGYALYDNGSGRTVLWLPDCTSFTYMFNKPKPSEEGFLPYKEPLPEGMMESLKWFTAVTLVGDHRVDNNLMNRKSSRKGTRDYGSDDYGDKSGAVEEAIEDEYRDKFFWREGRFGEDPLEALIREERNREMLDALTDKQREVFILYYKEGYTQQQIADMLGVDQTSVRDRLVGAIKKVKKYF